MDKIFEIVSSLIPDEQKDDIKSKIDGELKSVIATQDKQIKKELSSKYKINFFEEDITKAYNGDTFIQKSVYDELENEIKSLKEGATNFETEIKGYQDKVDKYEIDQKLYNSQLNLISNGLRIDRLDLVRPHIKGEVEEDLKLIKESYPELFLDAQGQRQTFPGEKDGEGKSAMANYFEKKAVVNKTR